MTGAGFVTSHRALQRVEMEGWADRDNRRCRLRVAQDAERVIRAQIGRDSPARIFCLAPTQVRATAEMMESALSSGMFEVFPGCSPHYLYIDVSAGLGSLEHLLRENAQLPCEVGYLIRGLPPAFLRLLVACGAPAVVLGYVSPDINLPCIFEDMHVVGRMAGELLLRTPPVVALCHRELIGAEVFLVNGMAEAADGMGIPEPSRADFYYHLSAEPAEYSRAIELLLTGRDRPRSILALQPEFAMAVLQVAARHRIAIPDELQVVGLRHNPMYAFAYPTITSIGPWSTVELGRRSAELLAEAMVGPSEAKAREVIRSTLIERESTLPREGRRP